MTHRIGIDLGGTKIEGIVLDPDSKEIYRKRIPTEREHGYEHILNRITALYQELKDQISGATHTLGMGTPGAISKRTGLMKNSNTTCLNEMPFGRDLETKLGRSLEIQNDANCFALAEALHGAGKGKSLVFGVIMGTGCGGGIVHEGKTLTGPQSIAGEWGHMTIDPAGPLCYCGKKGCVETLISGHGLESLYQSRFGQRKDLPTIVTEYRDGDEKATQLMKGFFTSYGRALSNVINILDPDVIVLGGGVSNIDELYTEGLEQVKKNTFSDCLETPILKHTLGDSAGVLGAALIGSET